MTTTLTDGSRTRAHAAAALIPSGPGLAQWTFRFAVSEPRRGDVPASRSWGSRAR